MKLGKEVLYTKAKLLLFQNYIRILFQNGDRYLKIGNAKKSVVLFYKIILLHNYMQQNIAIIFDEMIFYCKCDS